MLLCAERLEDKQGKVSCDVLDMRHSLSYMGVRNLFIVCQ